MLFALGVVILLAVTARVMAGTWMHPSPLFAAAWAIFLGLPTVVSNDFIDAPTMAGLVAAGTFAVVLFSPITVRPHEVSPSEVTSTRRLRRFVWLGAAAGAVAGVMVQRANGVSVGGILSLEALNGAALEITQLRYAGDLVVPLPAVLLLGLTYGAAVAAPFAAASTTGLKSRLLLAAPTLGGAFYAISTTARAGFLIAACITAGVWMMLFAAREGGRPRLRAKAVLGALFAAVAIAGLFIYGAAVRLEGVSNAQSIIMDRITLYTSGGIPAFEWWLANEEMPTPSFLPIETLAGVSQVVMGDPSLGNAYDIFAPIGGGATTNIYTMFRPLVEDFTLPGALVVLALAGAAAASGYRRAVTRRSVRAVVVVGAWNGVVLFSMTTSILTFVNVVLGLGFAWWFIPRHATLAPTAAPGSDSSDLGPERGAGLDERPRRGQIGQARHATAQPRRPRR